MTSATKPIDVEGGVARMTMREIPSATDLHDPSLVLLTDPLVGYSRPGWVIALPHERNGAYRWYEVSDTTALALAMLRGKK